MSAGRPRTGWWAESISDGGAHYGVALPGGVVHARCNRVFMPLPNPWTCEVECQQRPADRAHACPACLIALAEDESEQVRTGRLPG